MNRRRLLLALGLLLLVPAGMALSVVMPLWRDDHALDAIVVAVALDWRDFGEPRARQRLQYELDHQGIGPHVRDEDCALTVEQDGDRLVACAWSDEVRFPGVAEPVVLSFSSSARVDRNGTLLR